MVDDFVGAGLVPAHIRSIRGPSRPPLKGGDGPMR